MEVKDFLIRLCECPHVSGFESAGADIVREAFSEYLDDVSTDKLGNVIGLKRGRGKGKLMLAAHMDEIGLMVAGIDEMGRIGFTALGGFDARVFPAMEVFVHGKERIYGVIGIKPPHILPPEEYNKVFKPEDLFVDTGYGRDRLAEIVSIGDVITIKPRTAELKNGFISTKSMDDMVGVATLLSAIQHLKRYSHDLDVYFVATVQEEVGIRGAKTSAYSISPDMAIALDVGFGRTPDVSDAKAIEMGMGPGIAAGPGIHPVIFDRLKSAAKNANLKYQVEVLPSRTGTDTDNMQISGYGVATGVLSVPVKYMHTPVETVKLDDIDQAGRLLAEFTRSFDDEELEGVLCL